MQAHQLLADRLQAASVCLRYDPDFVAAKQKSLVERKTEEKVGSRSRGTAEGSPQNWRCGKP